MVATPWVRFVNLIYGREFLAEFLATFMLVVCVTTHTHTHTHKGCVGADRGSAMTISGACTLYEAAFVLVGCSLFHLCVLNGTPLHSQIDRV